MVVLNYNEAHHLGIWNETKYEIQEKKLITQSWRNWESSDFLCINSQNVKNSVTIDTKRSNPFSFLSVVYLYSFTNKIESQSSQNFGYDREERNCSISSSLSSLGARSLSSHVFGTSDTSFNQSRYQPWQFYLTVGFKRVTILG